MRFLDASADQSSCSAFAPRVCAAGPRRTLALYRDTMNGHEDVLKWVKIRAARTGKPDSAVIEESLRRDLKLDVLNDLWSSATLGEQGHRIGA